MPVTAAYHISEVSNGRNHTMQVRTTLAGLLLTGVLITPLNAQEVEFLDVTGPYLGQNPPGNVPELFGPGIISVESNFEHSAAAFSPDGREVFWCTNVNRYTEPDRQGMLRLYYMEMVDGRWTAPRMAPFTDENVERPMFSPDGNSLYFEKVSAPGQVDNMDIFVVHRTGDGWSEPAPVSSLINTPAIERLHCVAGDGSLYFARDPFTNREQIFISRISGGVFTEPVELGESFNSDATEVALLVSPDGRFMLVEQLNDHYTGDLYVSYRNADGSWSDRVRTPYQCGGFLSLSPDGQYLFMLEEGIRWVSTAFVDELKP
jgi:Tol biopolymer transport system component